MLCNGKRLGRCRRNGLWDEGVITYEKAMEQVKDVYKIFVKEISDDNR